jgi:integrator complex subunit 11
MPGYCVAGTVGAKVLSGAKVIEMEGSPSIQVRLSVEYLSFSAHADAKGIMQLIKQSDAQNVVLVHGERKKMGFLAKKITQELGKPCHFPANGQSIEIQTPATIPIKLSRSVLKRAAPAEYEMRAAADVSKRHQADDDAAVGLGDAMELDTHGGAAAAAAAEPAALASSTEIEGILLMRHGEDPKLIAVEDVTSELGLDEHALAFSSTVTPSTEDAGAPETDPLQLLGLLHKLLVRVCDGKETDVSFTDASLHLRSVGLQVQAGGVVHVSWSYPDDELAQHVLAEIRRLVDSAEWRGGED